MEVRSRLKLRIRMEVIMNIFDCAIKMEDESREYYEKLSMAVTIPEMKNLFSLLATAEKEHLDALVKIKGNSDLKKIQFSSLQEVACVFKPLLAKRDLIAELKSDPDAYLHALKQEEDGVRFYEALVAKAEDEATREILVAIAEEEKKHLNIIENIYSFVESPRTYLAWGEFSNLEAY
jgi:rubrerythrin